MKKEKAFLLLKVFCFLGGVGFLVYGFFFRPENREWSYSTVTFLMKYFGFGLLFFTLFLIVYSIGLKRSKNMKIDACTYMLSKPDSPKK
ncbi:MAG: hypothetical protein KAR54_02435 [Candidatus Pacebacteria bacterium]|nr:hypothetical protein [Candidatus Paceibacterota bacterium]